MKKLFKNVTVFFLGMVFMLVLIRLFNPIQYYINTLDNTATFTVDGVISDYETLERNENTTKFKIYFEQD